MHQIFIHASHADLEVASMLSRRLTVSAEVMTNIADLRPGDRWEKELDRNLSRADVILIILSRHSLDESSFSHSIEMIRNYAVHESRRALLIPILLDDFSPDDLPVRLSMFQWLPARRDALDQTAEQILLAIAGRSGERLAQKSEREERSAEIQETAADYIEEAIGDLSEREGEFRKRAERWYLAGWISLMVGIIAATSLFFLSFGGFAAGGELGSVIAFSIKGVLVMTLVVALSRYSFSLAKSYMEESLKNADRLHAIGFGKFYLKAYPGNGEFSELKEVFQHWNIGDTKGFRTTSAEDFDPKMIETALEFAKLVHKK